MKIVLIGYGKMGKEIEQAAISRGHEIALIIDKDNLSDFTPENLAKYDVAIEFTSPESALANFEICFKAGIPVVTGTTGWHTELENVKKNVLDNDLSLFHASNFSLGVNIFFELNKYLGKIMNRFGQYSVEMEEIHHTQKLDAPSGTAITLAEDLMEVYNEKKKWVNSPAENNNELYIKSVRKDNIPGIHTITYTSEVDYIEIKHSAQNRKGLAAGAVSAAEFMIGRKGIYSMKDLFKEIINTNH